MHTPEQIAILASELEGCGSVDGQVQVPTKLANRILRMLRKVERESREWVVIERIE